MKKRLLSLLAGVFAILSLSSCEDLGIISDIIEEGLFGEATVYITNTDQDNNSTVDTVKFASSVVDNFTIVDDASETSTIATIDFCAQVDLSNAALAFPFMAFQVSDTATGSYTVNEFLTTERLRNFNFDTLASIIRSPAGFNLVVIALSDTAWYISNSGAINISEFPAVGYTVKGTFNNVKAYYVTQSDIDRINDDMMNTGQMIDLDGYLPQVTLTGSFSSRRTTIIHDLVQQAFYEGGLSNL